VNGPQQAATLDAAADELQQALARLSPGARFTRRLISATSPAR
jgi:hypothetical protein